MARNTDINLRSQCIYSVYVRNHSKKGNFKGVTSDLDRIKDLGADILWLLPIHPIGKKNRKGGLGCPYSIEDYRKVNPEYGTIDDFRELVEETHKRGMRIMIDVVYNHTSHNSVLYNEYKEYFYRKPDGSTGNKVGDWTDIIDLDYNNMQLWDYQIETLKYWAEIGVDGFRCDVAPLVAVEFWLKARKEVSEIKEGVIWLAETVEPNFIKYLRDNNVIAHSDSEVFEAFDITYDYDTFEYFKKYLDGQINLGNFLDKKRAQEVIYPSNYIKLRFIENHDQPRAAYILPEKTDLMNWTAFMFLEKGTSLVYAGQETADTNWPSLFDIDPVQWDKDKKFAGYIKNLIEIKKNEIFVYGNYNIVEANKNGVIEIRYEYKGKKLIGIFNVERKIGEYKLDIEDCIYRNLINEKEIEVKDGKFNLPLYPVLLEV
ncbi:MAG: alpha-amylase family glycosyl hydrolase [Clostridiaceae bacterium]